MKNQVIAVALLGTVFLAGCSSNAGNIRKEQTPSSVSASSSARSTSASPSPTESPSPSPSQTPSPTASPTPEPVKTPEAVTPVAEPTPEVPVPEPEQKPVPAEDTQPATEAPAPARQTPVQQDLCNRNLLWLRLPQIPECTTRTVTKPVQLARHLSIKASLDTLLTWTVMETAWPANPTKEKVIRGNSFLPAFCLSLNSFSLNTPPSPFSVALVRRPSVHGDASKD